MCLRERENWRHVWEDMTAEGQITAQMSQGRCNSRKNMAFPAFRNILQSHVSSKHWPCYDAFVLFSFPFLLFFSSFLSHSTEWLPATQLLETPATHAQSHTCGAILKISAHTSPCKRQQWMIEEKTALACFCEFLSNQSTQISGFNNRMDPSYPT